MSIREALPADAAVIAGLVRDLGYTTDAAAVRAQLQDVAASADDVVLVVERDEAVVGFVAVSRTRSLIEPAWFGRITALCVAGTHRRTGVGARLVGAAEAWAVDNEVTLLQVNSGRRPERTAAHAFYPALGYRDQHDHHVLYEKHLEQGERRS
jgi:GNAT superfamily N-acetyltransferase